MLRGIVRFKRQLNNLLRGIHVEKLNVECDVTATLNITCVLNAILFEVRQLLKFDKK